MREREGEKERERDRDCIEKVVYVSRAFGYWGVCSIQVLWPTCRAAIECPQPYLPELAPAGGGKGVYNCVYMTHTVNQPLKKLIRMLKNKSSKIYYNYNK